MTDSLTPAKRSWNMSRIQGKNTKPELIVRSYLHRLGYRFRLHRKGLPGKPDIILPKHNLVIFVHGCYWHRHKNCKLAYTPKSNQEFWLKKFSDNVQNDVKVKKQLHKLGWRLAVIWECETENMKKLERKLHQIFKD